MKSSLPEWFPYFAPMIGFALVLAAAGEIPGYELPFLIARAAAPLALFAYFAWKRCYPELRGFRPGFGGAAADTLVGLGVACVWVAPYLLWPGLRPGTSEAFDASVLGEAWRPAFLALRWLGFVMVTPVTEELLVRSYLMRAADVYNSDRDFREIPVGHFAWRSFLFTVAWFTFTHATWEWPVALVTAVVYNLWLYRRKHIGALILTHAVTNGALFLLVVLGSGQIPDGQGGFLDLWYFL